MAETETNSLQTTEAMCAAGRTAPRVALSDIEAAIEQTYYANARNMLSYGPLGYVDPHKSLSVLTVCFVVMKNGFTIIGKAAPASPENFDPNLGRKLAYEDAVRQIWPLMGFALRDRLAEGESL